VLPCSARKRQFPRFPIAAAERYDGPLYRVLRKALREGRVHPSTDVVIVSAKHGLLDPDTPIRFYDQRLSGARVQSLASEVRADLTRRLRSGRYRRICINLGRDYAAMLEGLPALRNARWASGSIGVRAALLKSWLTLAPTDKAVSNNRRGVAVADGK
jgi:hypothetical protein